MMQTKSAELPEVAFILSQCEESMRLKLKDSPPALFHLNSGGHRIRAMFCVQAGIALHLPTKSIIAQACTIELLHNASLIHDDLQDLEAVRRDKPSVWKQYGKSHAICAGDVMISAAYGALADIGNHPALAALLAQTHQAVSITAKGQSYDLNATNNISQEQYEEIAAMKSGPLVQLTLNLPLLMADMPQHIAVAEQALQQFAIAYQIVDDFNDWRQDAQQNNLNLVNLLAQKCPIDEAIYSAQNRAQDLLVQCEQNLALLPFDCAASIIKAAQTLALKTKENAYE